jgi:hypothetical protein
VSQDGAVAEIMSRTADGRWSDPLHVRGLAATLRLDALGIDLPLAEIYADVELDAVG